ncbi:hydrogenase maturation protease [Mycobacterium sp. SMC-4]|uniref:hydrogenase maturation protease n=1 Tax=Mycobacterium sp. SMC-4 TaxID=2857059 RepID=UPI0021B2CB4B|nr:hydrogenase maturation protease [Mycobacterium sp. SMC-4]UXA17336.1 hydrogenase maturation protease [Mycobacterium sp. SMC-4]
MSRPRAVVIGIGNRLRSDDAIGPIVAARLDALELPGLLVTVCDGEPAGLIDTWAGVDLAVIIDAIRCDPPTPGRIRRATVEMLRGTPAATGSHAVNIPEAFRLGRALGQLPGELVIIAVEAGSLARGCRLTQPVAAAAPGVLRAVFQEIARVGIAEPIGATGRPADAHAMAGPTQLPPPRPDR